MPDTASSKSPLVDPGVSGLLWLDALSKHQTNAVMGKGGIEAFSAYFGNIHTIPALLRIRQEMKVASLYFEAALSKCSERHRERDPSVRSNEIFRFMGVICPQCGIETTFMTKRALSVCPRCQVEFEYLYPKVLEELIASHILPSPEAVLMSYAYDRLAVAYEKAYEGMVAVTEYTARLFGWSQFRIESQELKNYWNKYFFGRQTGEINIIDEEKKTLQLITRGPAAGVDSVLAQRLIRLFIDTVKYGYIYENLGVVEVYALYCASVAKFNPLYNQLNAEISRKLGVNAESRHRVVHKEAGNGKYAPFWVMDPACWKTGKIASEVRMFLTRDLPLHPRFDFAAMVAWFAPQGSGKTFVETALITDAFLNTDEFVFSPLGDKSNNFSVACLPLFRYSRRTDQLQRALKETLGVVPRGIPMLHINVLKRGEKIDNVELNPPTIFDVVVEVEDYDTFTVDFKELFVRLREVNEWYGLSGPPKGLMVVRNLDRSDLKTNSNVDLRVLTNMLVQFGKYRKGCLEQPCRMFIDELSYVAASQIDVGGGDASKSAGFIDDAAKEMRRENTTLDFGTQIPKEIRHTLRKGMTTCFFKELGVSDDKPNSEIDFLLGILKAKNKAELKPVIKQINEEGLPRGMWFGWDRNSREFNIFNPCPPVCCLNDPVRTNLQLIKRYEVLSQTSAGLARMGLGVRELGSRAILVRNAGGRISWDGVPVLKSGTEKKVQKSKMNTTW